MELSASHIWYIHITTNKDLPPGRLLTMVNLKNPRQLRVIDSTNVPHGAHQVIVAK